MVKIIVLIINYIIMVLMKPQVKELNSFYVKHTSFGISLYEVGFRFQFFLAIVFYILGMKPSMVENKLPVLTYVLFAFILICLLTKANNDVRKKIIQNIEEIEQIKVEDQALEELAKETVTLSKIDSLHHVFEMFLTITMGHAVFLLLSTWLYE